MVHFEQIRPHLPVDHDVETEELKAPKPSVFRPLPARKSKEKHRVGGVWRTGVGKMQRADGVDVRDQRGRAGVNSRPTRNGGRAAVRCTRRREVHTEEGGARAAVRCTRRREVHTEEGGAPGGK